MTVCAIHQPNFVPWLGYFLKIALCDKFVYLDNVQFSKGSYTNRVRIIDGHGRIVWLTVPVEKRGLSAALIKDVRIAKKSIFFDHLMEKISEYYRKAKHKNQLFDLLEESYGRGASGISDLNISIIENICTRLGLGTTRLKASEFSGLPNDSTKRLTQICANIGCDSYITGSGGASYLRREEFELAGISLMECRFSEPIFTREDSNVDGGLSVIERIANTGFEGLREALDEAIESSRMLPLK
ncbi:WbqC family protein [Marimonas sp. MJW-29]|uniref:WbqC family protein n=1 Tax=Sulfitobacter sediminis TaxID=3234186 RepID=A0ABV3RN69_9RHOB